MILQRDDGWCEFIGYGLVFVASEPGGRNRKGVEPLRDCCVNAYGLLDPERQPCCNLSGTAGVEVLHSSQSKTFGTSAFLSRIWSLYE